MSKTVDGRRIAHVRHWWLALSTIGITVLLVLTVAEIAIRIFIPQESMYPRFKFSSSYGLENYSRTRIRHSISGRWEFWYSTNEFGFRGPSVDLSAAGQEATIVVLGDSYTFGAGVNDGEEYASVLQRELGRSATVVNLGVGGWGLTQEIRKYYEFGRLYRPCVVILQFSGNDPADNIAMPVTRIENGHFVFKNIYDRSAGLKTYLSASVVQKSQVYNLIRSSLFRVWARYHGYGGDRLGQPGLKAALAVTREQSVYVGLLEAFAADLTNHDVTLIMISVNEQLKEFPYIEQAVKRLGDNSQLRYIEVADWFKGVRNYESPEGHNWGARGHAIVGKGLAQELVDGPLAAPRCRVDIGSSGDGSPIVKH